MNYQNFDGSSSAPRKTSKEAALQALEPFSLPKVVEEVVVIKKLLRQNTYEKRLFLKEAKILNELSTHRIVRLKGFCANPLAMMPE